MEKPYQGEDQKKFHFLFMISAHSLIANENEVQLKGIDPKVLFMTARPGRCRAFKNARNFLSCWENYNKIFLGNPPNISFISDGMQEDSDSTACSLDLHIHSPSQVTDNGCTFKLTQPFFGKFNNVILFIDWPANEICPDPIKLQVPSLFKANK